eukprot:gene185-67_t
MKTRDAFSEDNPQLKEWVAALEKELNSCEGKSLDEPVLRLVPASEVGPDDELIPSMIICTIDVSTAFLQTDERDSTRMSGDGSGTMRAFLRPPKEAMKPAGWVYQVLKSIYGLRTAPRAWKQTLCRWLRSYGCRPARYDDSVWVHEPSGVNVLIYVDDLV